MSSAPFIAVVGASGGLGASTLALAVGQRLSGGPPSVVVDLDLTGGGLEVTAGFEHLPGRRWHDLADVQGRVPVHHLVPSLPGEGGCHVLGALGGSRPDIDPTAVLDVVDSLVDEGVPTVLDLPARSALLSEVVTRSPVVVVLLGLRTRALADAESAVERVLAVPGRAEPVLYLVTRGPRSDPDVIDDVVDHLGVGHLHHLRDDPAVGRSGERGAFPGRSRDAVRAAADAVVGTVLPRRVAS